MKTNKLLAVACLVIFSLNAWAQADDNVTIQGTITHIANKMQVQDMSEFSTLNLPNDERSFIPDSKGHFNVSFKLSNPNYFRLGRNILYLSPGDKLDVKLDYADSKLASFTGKGAAANTYLAGTLYPHAGSFLEAGNKLQDGVETTVDYIVSAGKDREKELSRVKDVTPDFRRYEEARIKADILNSMIMMRVYFPYTRHYAGADLIAFMTEHIKAIAPYKAQYAKELIDPDYLKVQVVSLIVKDIISVDDQSPNTLKVKDWINASQVADKLQHQGNKESIEALKPKIDAIADTAYRAAVTKTYNSLIKFGNGDKAIDFAMTTADGKAIHLNDYTGKVIFVDLWASWCGPCINEMPYLEKLKEKYKNNPNVVFISLSIDNDKNAWRQKVHGLKASGLQVVTDRSVLNDYSVIDIPRTIVIDKNFNIAAMKGNLPSNKETETLLDNLLASSGAGGQ